MTTPETKSSSAKATADKWRAEPDPSGGDEWRVSLVANGKTVIAYLDEPTARLIAAAPAKAALCEELADALRWYGTENNYDPDSHGHSNVVRDRGLRAREAVTKNFKAMRAPQ